MSHRGYQLYERTSGERRVRFSDGEPDMDSVDTMNGGRLTFGPGRSYPDIPAVPQDFVRESDLRDEDIGKDFPLRGRPKSPPYNPDAICSGGRHPSDPYPERLRLMNLEYGEEPISTMSNVQKDQVVEAFERQQLPEPAAREQVSFNSLSLEDMKHYLKCLNDVHEPSKIREGLYVAKSVYSDPMNTPEELTGDSYETACHYLTGRGNRTKHYPKVGYVLSLIDFLPKEDHLFDTLEPVDLEEFPDHTRLLLNVKDSRQTNLMEFFPLIVSFIVRALRTEGRRAPDERRGILVHCRKGMSRSVAAVMAYLIWAERHLSVIEIWRQVKAARSVSWPNSEFYTQLVMWKMLNCALTDEQGDVKVEYREYVLAKGLRSAMEGVRADLSAHMVPKLLIPPLPW